MFQKPDSYSRVILSNLANILNVLYRVQYCVSFIGWYGNRQFVSYTQLTAGFLTIEFYPLKTAIIRCFEQSITQPCKHQCITQLCM